MFLRNVGLSPKLHCVTIQMIELFIVPAVRTPKSKIIISIYSIRYLEPLEYRRVTNERIQQKQSSKNSPYLHGLLFDAKYAGVPPKRW
jgi:hypothetical protein